MSVWLLNSHKLYKTLTTSTCTLILHFYSKCESILNLMRSCKRYIPFGYSQFKPISKCSIFWVRYVVYAGIIWVLRTFFGQCIQNILVNCVFTAVCDTWCLPHLWSALCVAMDALYTNQPNSGWQGWGRDASPKKSSHFWSERVTHLLLNIMKDFISAGFWKCTNIATLTIWWWLKEWKREAVFPKSNKFTISEKLWLEPFHFSILWCDKQHVMAP